MSPKPRASRGSGYSMGAAVGDYDNDGRPDLYVTGVNVNALYRNDGKGAFTDVTDKTGVTGRVASGRKPWSVASAWVDYDSDGHLDLFVVNYLDWSFAKNQLCGDPGKRLFVLARPLRRAAEYALPQQRRRDLRRCKRRRGYRRPHRQGYERRRRRLQTTTVGPTFSSLTTANATFFSATSTANALKKSPSRRLWLSPKTAFRFRAWGSTFATSTTTAVPT